MNLSTLFEETTTGDVPPSRVGADEVYQAGLRRRRVSRAIRAGLAAVPVVALGMALAVVVPSRGGPADPAASGSAEPTASRAADTDSPVRPGYDFPLGALAGNGKHLYATYPPCFGCLYQLIGSDDGGRTWTVRQPKIAALGDLFVAPGGGLVSDAFDNRPGNPPHISLDGGRTARQAQPVEAVDGAPDRVTFCGRPQAGPRTLAPGQPPECQLTTVDLRAGTVGPLRTPPGITVTNVYDGADATLWAAGSVARGDTRVMAVARSDDGGRTWATHEFADAVGVTGGVYPDLRTGADGTVIADFIYDGAGGPERYIARHSDGIWRQLSGGPADLAEINTTAGRVRDTSYVDSDGTHILIRRTYDLTVPGERVPVTTTAFAARKDETTYRSIDTPAGLPEFGGAPVDHVTYVPGLGYLAVGTDALSFSTDAKAWRKLHLG